MKNRVQGSGFRVQGSGFRGQGSGFRTRSINTDRPPPTAYRLPPTAYRRRRGISTLVVLLLLSMTLGLSYAVIRSQSTAVQIHYNFSRRAAARQAAVTGLTMALKKMHTNDWNGVDTALAGSLGNFESFQVTYTTGDPSLSAAGADYEDFPYRVTLLSTGYAADPFNPQCMATYQVRAVVRLVPRNLADEPSDWATMQQYTVYQSKKDDFEIDIPCRMEGPVRVQGKLELAKHYPDDSDAWLRYLQDLNAMRLAGQPDYRPFSGPVDLPFSEQAGEYLTALTNQLGVAANDQPVSAAASDWVKPTSLTTYQIYAGGPVYTIPSVDTTLEDTSLGPDPLTNPLGLYYRNGNVTIRGNVTISGSLFCKDDINIEGANVRFEPVELPAVDGSQDPVRLPVATCQNFVVKPSANGSVAGLLAVFDKFEISKSPETVRFAITGRVITRKLYIKERQPWETLNWEDYYEDFEDQLDGAEGPVVPYFPVWMGYRGRDPQPLLTVKPDPAPVRYHWHDPQYPVYVPHPDDDGLRWDLLEWTENPM